jgi:hypothetical protein
MPGKQMIGMLVGLKKESKNQKLSARPGQSPLARVRTRERTATHQR